MTKCPCCGNELKIIEGTVKFAAHLGENNKEENCCEMPERDLDISDLFVKSKDEVKQ